MTEPIFLRTMVQAVSAVVAAQDLCRVVVEAALDDVLLNVAKEHNLNYTELVRKHKSAVVDTCFAQSDTQCKGKTRTGDPCNRKSLVHGYCAIHREQGTVHEEKRRRIEAYDASIKHRRIQQSDNADCVIEEIQKHIVPARKPFVDITNII